MMQQRPFPPPKTLQKWQSTRITAKPPANITLIAILYDKFRHMQNHEESPTQAQSQSQKFPKKI